MRNDALESTENPFLRLKKTPYSIDFFEYS